MQPSTILVTGGCGYLGARFLRDLSGDPRFGRTTVRILDNLSRGSYVALADLEPLGRVEFIEGDILDQSALRLALHGVDCVLHLAGIVTTPVSFDRDRSMEQVNHWGTSNLVSTCLEQGVPRLIYSSSVAVYGPGTEADEESSCRPVGSYARTVRAAELGVLGARARGLDVHILRLGTVYGYALNMRFDNVVNRFAILAALGKPLTVYGDGSQRRPIIHVADVSGLLRHVIMEPAAVPELLNAAECSPSIIEVCEAVRAAAPGISLHYTEQDILTHLSFQVSTVLLAKVGWNCSWPLERGVSEIIHRFTGVRSMRVPGPAAD
jgi:nucleoside-diphosphate-sugar epimerase